MLIEFQSRNTTVILGAGASRADGGLLEVDLLPGIHELRSLTMNIPASDFAQSIGISNPTFSYVLTTLRNKLNNNPPNSQELQYIYNSMIEGLINVLSFSGGSKTKNDLHLRLFTHCLNNCDEFSTISLNYDPIAESSLIEISKTSGHPDLDFWIDFENALMPLPNRPPFRHPPFDPNNPREGSWEECENTKQSIEVALKLASTTPNDAHQHVTNHNYRHNSIDFLKLHGSTRWLICEHCGLPHTAIPPYANLFEVQVVEATLWMIGHHFPGYCALLCKNCGLPLRANIVPPGPETLRSQHGLTKVWERALENLVKSNDWLFVGYSFPLYDTEIQSLLNNALIKRKIPPKIWIVDYYANSHDSFTESPVIARAKSFFGEDIIERARTSLGGLQCFPEFENGG